MRHSIAAYMLAGFLLLLPLTIAHAEKFKAFDSNAVAAIETQLWKDYYRQNYRGLLQGLTYFFHAQFNLSYADAFLVSSKAVHAAYLFGRLPRTTNDAVYQREVLPVLVEFFASLEKVTGNDWDEQAIAQAELAWWVARRKPGHDHVSNVGQHIATVYQLIYGSNNACIQRAGYLRAKAGSLRDRQQQRQGKVDWKQVNNLLEQSYQQLKKGITDCQ